MAEYTAMMRETCRWCDRDKERYRVMPSACRKMQWSARDIAQSVGSGPTGLRVQASKKYSGRSSPSQSKMCSKLSW